MAQQPPWSVKGVRPECRDAAKVAARRSNQTIGEWLNVAIMNAARQSVPGGDAALANHQMSPLPLSELTQAIETLSAELRLLQGLGGARGGGVDDQDGEAAF